MIIDLTKGIGDYPTYKLFRFPGGELHFKSKVDLKEPTLIQTRLNTSRDITALGIVVDTLHKEGCPKITVLIPYMPYAQADRDFSIGESFTLKTMINRWFNQLPVDKYLVFDPHSDVTAALLKNSQVIPNDGFISLVMDELTDDIVWLSPDAGAYKKIFNLAERIGFKGEILCCQKHRDTKDGSVQVVVPPLPNQDVLIIDDICVGGRTFIEISKAIPRTGKKLYLAVSHGIFSNGFGELAQHFTKVFTTDSRTDIYPTESFGKVPQTFLTQFHILHDLQGS